MLKGRFFFEKSGIQKMDRVGNEPLKNVILGNPLFYFAVSE